MTLQEVTDRSWVQIDLDAFRQNLRELKAFLKPSQGFMQIVKADAYGHGALEICRVAIEEGAIMLGVANVEEGKLLRIQGCKNPVLVLSPSLEAEIPDIIKYGLNVSISDMAFARRLNDAAKKANTAISIHIKIDSGMHRSGICPADFAPAMESLKELPFLLVEGVFSHYASSENDAPFSFAQLDRFNRLIEPYRPEFRYIHIANSSALINGLSDQDNLVRLGILSYGIYTHHDQKAKIKLRPVMSFISHLAQIKEIKAGEGLGYQLSWKAREDTLFGIIPVGYADGYDFLLSNRGVAMIGGQICPVIGRVSMDMICVDLSGYKDAQTGDEVILMGQGVEALRAEHLVASYSGSAYELLCQVGRRAKRYYVQRGAVSHSAPMARRDFVSSDFSDSKLNRIIQSALSQRLGSEEIGELISREILRYFFFNKDQDIHYRKAFVHHIELTDSTREGYWRAKTLLSFSKVLQNEYFIVACANSDEALKSYFLRKDVEYRWLMDDTFELSDDAFELSEVYVNDIKLEAVTQQENNCLEIRCQHPRLNNLVGNEVQFTINTLSYYPKSAHQLSVFINELTHGVKVSLSFPHTLIHIEVVPVFSGQNHFPEVQREPGRVSVSTKAGQWVFPLSGIVFAY